MTGLLEWLIVLTGIAIGTCVTMVPWYRRRIGEIENELVVRRRAGRGYWLIRTYKPFIGCSVFLAAEVDELPGRVPAFNVERLKERIEELDKLPKLPQLPDLQD